ncbi:MAG TPA: nodulation protein NfeD, partial [Paludibacteraceae bacterium]|nr:nodulation protein NfeD [Paludibacteraceae bacterium]
MKKLLFGAIIAATSLSQAATIYQIDINDNIGSKTWVYTKRGFSEAEALNANLVLLRLNTYGGELSFADSIRTQILNSDIQTVAFIDNNAASAGALISIACDRIYMRKGASLGAATVVAGTDGQQMPDKYQSYMRATMRSTAEAHGKDSLGRWKRDPLIAEAMVDNHTVIPNIIDSGKTLTFTTEEAIANRYCEGVAETVIDVLEKEGYSVGEYELITYKPTFYDKLKGILTNTIFQSLLIMFIIGGIYFELQTPGIGFPLVVAIVASVLYFAPLYIDGLAANWEIIIFFIGVILLILEIFVIPG